MDRIEDLAEYSQHRFYDVVLNSHQPSAASGEPIVDSYSLSNTQDGDDADSLALAPQATGEADAPEVRRGAWVLDTPDVDAGHIGGVNFAMCDGSVRNLYDANIAEADIALL